jgi:cell shape-determining protein MreC
MTPPSFKDQTSVLLAILVASFLLLADLVGILGWFKTARAYVLYPVQSVGGEVIRNTRDTLASLVKGNSLKRENLSLRQRVLELENVVTTLEQAQQKQTGYQAFLQYTAQEKYKKVVTAQVLDTHADLLQGKLTLGQGSRAGISVGMPVVLGSTYVGFISEVTPFESKCITVYLPNQEFLGYVQKRKLSGIVKVGINGMELGDLLASEQVALHDVVSLKREGFPYFFTLGTISRAPLNNGSAERTAGIVSPIQLDELNFVTIIQE